MRNVTIVLCIIFNIQLSATIINIPFDQPTIQMGINTSVDGDTVLVQPNTYVENINFYGKNITLASLFLTIQDSTLILQTTIDGDNNGCVVKFTNSENTNALLYGFRIINGSSGYDGGGIFIDGASPSINYCLVNENRSKGIRIDDNSAPNIFNCTISYNYGDGIICTSNLTSHIENVIISNNQWGSGLTCIWSNPVIENSTIKDNYTFNCGAGIFLEQSSPTLTNMIISNNTAEPEHPDASSWGAGICMQSNCNPIITNTLISNNHCWGPGAAISAIIESNVTLINSTITSNLAQTASISIGSNSILNIINSILWGNTPYELNTNNSILNIEYSNIEGGESQIISNNSIINWLEGNINVSPNFMESGEHPFSLIETSPCIDTGIPDTTGLNLPLYDLIINQRIWDGDYNGSEIIDMGAYEFGAPSYVGVNESIIPHSTLPTFYIFNFPNPFNPSTTINFSIHSDSKVELAVYNVKGQKVKTLVDDDIGKGSHLFIWNGNDDNNNLVSSGVYLYKLNINGRTEAVNKCIMMK